MIETIEALKIDLDKNLNDAIVLAKKLYLEGSIFIYPTDTIYGIGGNPFNEDAVKKINKIKGRSENKKHILLVNNIEKLLSYVDIPSEKYIDLLLALWPNPVSVVLNLNKKFKKIFGTSSIAFRIPNHKFCLNLLEELNMPLISTSVNKSDDPPLNEPSLIFEQFSHSVRHIFYSNKKNFHQASTIIDLTKKQPQVLREGTFMVNGILDKYLS